MADEVTGIAGIPRRLFRARKLLAAERGTPVTQAWVAAQVGVTEGQIGHWEKGRQMPDLPMIEKLAAALEVRPEWLTYGMGPAEPPAETINIGGLEIDRDSIVRFSDAELAEARRQLAEEEARERERAAPAPAPRKAVGKKRRPR